MVHPLSQTAWQFLQKLNTELPYDPAISSQVYTPKILRRDFNRYLYTNDHCTIIAKQRKHPKCLSADERINKMWCIHTMECYSSTKRNEVLIHATTWMKLKNITLYEKGRTNRKDKYYSTYMKYLEQANSDRKQNGVCQGLREGGMGSYCLTVTDFLFGMMKKF